MAEHYQSLDEVLSSDRNHGTSDSRDQRSGYSLYHAASVLSSFAPGICLFLLAQVAETQLTPHTTPTTNYDPSSIEAPLLPQTVSEDVCSLLAWGVPAIAMVLVCLSMGSLRRLHTSLVGLVETAAYVLALTTLVKKMGGSLRPNFKNLCMWSTQLNKCTAPDYVENSARQSFPSGHSSAMGGGMAFLALFLCGELTRKHCSAMERSVVRALSLLPTASLAVWVAMTRVWDHFHRFEDISVGLAIGVWVGTCFAYTHLETWGGGSWARQCSSTGLQGDGLDSPANKGAPGGSADSLVQRERMQTLRIQQHV